MGLIYKISKYFAFGCLLAGFPEAFVLVGRKKVYFNNFNSVGIFNNAYLDSLAKTDIYKDIDCYIDVGAHMGFKSFWFHEINPKARIAVFEPNTVTFSFLERNLKHITDATKNQVALGSESGKANIYLDPAHLDTASVNRKSFYLNNNAKGEIQSIEVDVKKLDDYENELRDAKNIYLKVDVETFEKEVLKGAQKILKRVKYLEIEVLQDENNRFSDLTPLLPGKFKILSKEVLKSTTQSPKVETVLLSFEDSGHHS